MMKRFAEKPVSGGAPDLGLGGAALQRCIEALHVTRALAPEVALALLLLCSLGCSRSASSASVPKPTGYGAAIVDSSGGKQTAEVGTQLAQPVVVQVNDEQGNAVTGALVVIRGPNGTYLDPARLMLVLARGVLVGVSMVVMC